MTNDAQHSTSRSVVAVLTAPTCANAASRRSSRSAISRDDLSQYPQHPAFPDGFITDPYCCVSPPDDLGDVDDRFVFDFHSYDDLEDGQCWSTWLSVEPLCRGPEPLPDWVATSQSAIDTELGVLKTGKEADVHLVERADPLDPAADVVMAAKRYRSPGYRTFHRAASCTEGRSMKRSRDERAIKRKSEQAGVEAEVLGWLMARPVRDRDTTVAIAQLSRERGQDPSEVLVWYQRAAELGEENSWGWISDLAGGGRGPDP
ncbi:hypothetical protein [Streptomyces sp. NPDC058735]|uniref:hypothetical protein n=1 Tax=unclassified Streptomyces TaxID=2593676 RepID=UPI003684F770